MFSLSEIKRVTKKGGYFFGTFLPYEIIKKEKEKFYINVTLANGKKLRAYHKQDKSEPHLFYFLSKDFEYMQPHYYFKKDELKVVLEQFFKNVRIKFLKQKNGATFWFVYGVV